MANTAPSLLQLLWALALSMVLAQRSIEIKLTRVSLAVTAAATALLIWSTGTVGFTALVEGQIGRLLESILIFGLTPIVVYGNMSYAVARLGSLQQTQIRL